MKQKLTSQQPCVKVHDRWKGEFLPDAVVEVQSTLLEPAASLLLCLHQQGGPSADSKIFATSTSSRQSLATPMLLSRYVRRVVCLECWSPAPQAREAMSGSPILVWPSYSSSSSLACLNACQCL